MCGRMACVEPDWTVWLWESVRRKVLVAKLKVNPQIARTTTRTYQRACRYFAIRKSSAGATEQTILLAIIANLTPAIHQNLGNLLMAHGIPCSVIPRKLKPNKRKLV